MIWLSLIGNLEIGVASLHVEMATFDSIWKRNIDSYLGKRLMPQILGSLTTVSNIWRLKVILLLFFTLFLCRIGVLGKLAGSFVFLLFAMELFEFNLAGLFVINLLDLWAIVLWWRRLLWGFFRLLFGLLLLDELLSLLVFLEQLEMLVNLLEDNFFGVFILGEEIGFASHEREHGIEEVVDSLGILEGRDEQPIESRIFVCHFILSVFVVSSF